MTALPRRATHFQLAAHKVDQLPGQGKPQSQAAERARHGLIAKSKRLEKFFPLIFAQARPGIRNHKEQPYGPLAHGRLARGQDMEIHTAAGGIFDGIVQQNAQHFFQMALIAGHKGRDGGVQRKIEAQALFKGQPRHALAQQIHKVCHSKDLAFHTDGALTGAGKIQDTIDHVQQHAARLVDLRQIVPLHSVELCLQAQIAHADNGIERRAYLMADAAQEVLLHMRGPLGQLQRRKRLRPGQHRLLAASARALLRFSEFTNARIERAFHALQRSKHDRQLVSVAQAQGQGIQPGGHAFGIPAYPVQRVGDTVLKNISIAQHAAGKQRQREQGRHKRPA